MPVSRRCFHVLAAGIAAPLDAVFAQGGEALVARMRGAVVGIVVTPAQPASEPASAPLLEPAARRNLRNEVVGSGTLISPDGLVLTIASLFDSPGAVRVRFESGPALDGQVVARDRRSDLALVKIAGSDLPFARLAAVTPPLAVGERVWALGRPVLGEESTIAATDGVVSALGLASPDLMPYVQSNVALYPGMGGGPLVREKTGEVIGLTALQYAPRSGPGFTFAVPIGSYLAAEADLKRHGRILRGSIGISMRPLTDEIAKEIGLPARAGVIVSQVNPGSPADRAGMQAGDIVTAFGAAAVDAPFALINRIGEAKPGTRVAVTLWRRGRVLTLEVVVGDVPERAR